MKKLVCFIYLLSGIFCTTAMAQTSDNLLKIAGLEPATDGSVTYYLKNVGTGLHMSYGATWGTQCIETQAAHPIIVEDNGDGTFALASFGGYLDSDDLYMDKAKSESKWTLEPVDGYTNQYYLRGENDLVLTSVGNNAGILAMRRLDEKASQRWVFTNGDDMRDNKMPNATADNPFDVTVSIKGAAFDYVDSWASNDNTPSILTSVNPYNQKWENYGTHAKWYADCGVRNTPESYNYCGVINGFADAITVTYTMTLPAGTYHFSFEGFYKYMKVVSAQNQTKSNWYDVSWTNSGDPIVTTTDAGSTMAAQVTFAGQTFSLAKNTDNTIYDDGVAVAAIFRDNDTYKHHGTFYLASSQEVSIVISKPATTADSESTEVTGQGSGLFGSSYDNARTVTTTSYPSQIYIDEFTLLYYGPTEVAEGDIDDNAVFKNYLEANIEEYKSELNDEGKAAFDEVFATIDVNAIDSRSDYYAALEKLEEANTEAVIEHERSEALKDAAASGDYNNVIYNNSFELGDLTGWDLGGTSAETGVRSDLVTEGQDGTYLFNTWWTGVPITQTITGLPNGVYKMSVLVASGNTDNDGTVYLLGNNEKLGVNPPSGGGVFGDFSIKFAVTDGTATIGLVGGNDDDTAENPIGSYTPTGYWWYKADNFRLEYIDLLELDETATTMDVFDGTYAEVTVARTIKPNTWSSFVVPFDIPASNLGGWEIKELTGSTYDAEAERITLIFSDAADGIKAGVPYMVRNTSMASALTSLSMENVTVNTTLNHKSTDHVTFKGVYTNGYVPEGAFFISNNVFYQAADGTNTIKAFRGYIEVTGSLASQARSMSFRWNDERTTSIDNGQLTNDNEVTTVAIYNERGVRLSEMQPGLNILHMSDGSVVKVMIK